MLTRIISLFLACIMLTGFAVVLQVTAAGTPNVLVQGSQLHGANGVFFDSADRLHIACASGGEIVVMDRETGEILDRLGPDVGVIGPDDLTFGPDGSLYWTDIGVGEVGRLSPDGVITKQFVAPGVNPITFSDDGRLFTALCFLGDGLYELDPDLVDPPRLIVEGPGMLNAFDFGPDGFLYSPAIALSQVVRINVDTGEVTPLVEGLLSSSMKFDSQGNLHVVSPLTEEILRVDTETGSTEVIATLTFGPDNLAFDSQDRLFVAENGNGAIFEILPDGTTRAVNAGGMILPGDVAVLPRADGGESVFVADLAALREFDGSTGEVRGVEHAIPLPGGIAWPVTVSPDGDNLLLSSWFLGNMVQVWNPETREAVEEHMDFAVPMNAIRFQGDLVVAELGTEEGAARVVQASAVDPMQRVTLAEGLGVPAGLAATDDDLWVGDWATGMVLQIVADGQSLAEPVPVATDLASPEGLAVAPDGNLLVVETGAGRLSSINLETSEVSIVAEGLELGLAVSGNPPTYIFSGVAVGPSGTIYITSDINNQLLAIPPAEDYSNVFFTSLTPGLNMISLPLKPMAPYTARSLAEEISATVVVKYDETLGRFVGFTPDAPGDGFPIEGGKGYIVNVTDGGTVAFTGAAWTNEPPVEAAPPLAGSHSAWAFVASGSVLDSDGMSVSDGSYTVTVKNLRTGGTASETVHSSGYFAATWADLNRSAVAEAGDRVEIAVMDSSGNIVSGPFVHDITLDEIRDAVANVHLRLGHIIPEKSALLQNYPNPFNPETWIPYHLRDADSVVIRIHNASGQLVRTLDLGYRSAGIHASRSKAAYWDGKNEAGEEVASGLYFYSITAGDFSAMRKMIVTR